MRITKISWSQKRKNHFVNFYALEPNAQGKVEVLTPPFSWNNNSDAIAQINNERAKKNLPPYTGGLLHVVLDMSSGRLYLPNMEDTTTLRDDIKKKAMLDTIVINIEKLIDFLPKAPIIKGDPLSTIRLRKVGDFLSVANFIRRQVRDMDEFNKDIALPVVEADMVLMPATAKKLFGSEEAAKKTKWLFVDSDKGVVDFQIREGTGNTARDWSVMTQKPPFILINLARTAKTNDAEVEFDLVSAYREYAAANRPDNPGSKSSPQVQSFKYLMYIGWSFKELSLYVLQASAVSDFRNLLFRGSFLFNAAKALKNDGYPDPSSNPYYYSFRIGGDFPIQFRPEIGKDVFDYSRQPEIFRIVHYDPRSSYITIKSPLYLADEVINKTLMPKSEIFVSQYDPNEGAIKTDEPFEKLKEFSEGSSNAVVSDVAAVAGRKPADIPVKERFLTDLVFERKRISDYPQAAEMLKDLCAKLTKNPDREARAAPPLIKFDDLEVIVGPWMQTSGLLAGYYDTKRLAAKTGDKTVEPFPGFIVTPPAILIDNVEHPSVGDRTHMIVHEYRHHINSQLWIDSPDYDVSDKKGETQADKIAKHVKYLRSPNERVAHKTQFKYMLAIGMTKEQILRYVMGGKPTVEKVPVVKEYLGILDEAAKELQMEQDEEAAIERMRADVQKHQDDPPDVDSDIFDPSSEFDSLYN